MSSPVKQPRVRAPELDSSKDWLNTDRPVLLSQLRGKIVLLDFWTYCCINCLNILPRLKALEEKYADELVVIGVHSAKFTNERDTENLRQAVRRYEISHPVVNDLDFGIWQQYAVKGWPTLVLIDPEGYVVGGVSGESAVDQLDEAIGKLIEIFQAQGTLDSEPLNFRTEEPKVDLTRLHYPGKILADEDSSRLFISDTNNNRIVVTDLEGLVERTIGSGAAGASDGTFGEASLRHPQGLVLAPVHPRTDVRGSLFVADTGNHLIRRCDLEANTVETVAGTGEQSRQMGYYGGGPALGIALNSPWDLTLVKGELYIAMAGPHQIWFFNIEKGEIGPYAGSSAEACLDGILPECGLAQPSGITSDGEFLYVADSEASAVRAVPLDPAAEVETIVGEGLFQFGDRDGRTAKARFQHPLGIEYHNRCLFVADTYNHKIKRIDLKSRKVKTLAGTGSAGRQDGKRARFSEPSGLSVAADSIYASDTNNHAIRRLPLSGRSAETLKIDFG